MYSNGLSETILGNAIKQLKLPRDEIVVMTKVLPQSQCITTCVKIIHLDSCGAL